MALKLLRRSENGTTTIAVSAATSAPIVFDGYSFGGFILPAEYDGTTGITFTVCDTRGGTYVALEDATGAAISVVGEASKAYAFPPEIFAFPYGKIVAPGNQSTTDTVIPVCLRA